MVRFYSKTRYVTNTSAWYARVALFFFLLSTAGPFSLGYLMANGMGQSQWYYFSIYFYLHFQYNGLFLFGVFSLFFNLLERRKVAFNVVKAKAIGKILALTCLPAYLLSVLWARPGLVFNILGGVTAAIQLFALIMLTALIRKNLSAIRLAFHRVSLIFLCIVLSAFAVKLALQLISAFPDFAQMAYELRPVVIAYLHLVLLAVISLLLLVWYLETGLIAMAWGKSMVTLFLISLAGMELCLVLLPWWSKVPGIAAFQSADCIFFFSALLSLSCCLLLYAAFQAKKTDKNQFPG
jgi:hypothetical protein